MKFKLGDSVKTNKRYATETVEGKLGKTVSGVITETNAARRTYSVTPDVGFTHSQLLEEWLEYSNIRQKEKASKLITWLKS